jgi:hypothetical protein
MAKLIITTLRFISNPHRFSYSKYSFAISRYKPEVMGGGQTIKRWCSLRRMLKKLTGVPLRDVSLKHDAPNGNT